MAKVGLEPRHHHDADGQPVECAHDAQGDEVSQIVVKGVEGAEQQRGELSVAHALLKAKGGEGNIPLAHQRPGDIVAGQTGCGITGDLTTILRRHGAPDDERDTGFKEHPQQPEEIGQSVL